MLRIWKYSKEPVYEVQVENALISSSRHAEWRVTPTVLGAVNYGKPYDFIGHIIQRNPGASFTIQFLDKDGRLCRRTDMNAPTRVYH